MTRTPITESQFHEALTAVVREYGRDHRYPGWEAMKVCQYRDRADGNKPLCIMGAALFRIDPDYLPKEGKSIDQVLMEYNGLDWGEDHRPEWMRHAYSAQSMQDAGERWGATLDYYNDLEHHRKEVR